MTRSVSGAFIEAVNAPNTDEGFIICITIEHETLPAPLYLVNNSQSIVRTKGAEEIVFLALPITVTLSEDGDDRPPQAKLIMDNIDRTIIAAFRSISTPPIVTLELVRVTDVNTVEAIFTDFQLKGVDYNSMTVEGTLSLEGLFLEPAIGYTFTPSYFPGLF